MVVGKKNPANDPQINFDAFTHHTKYRALGLNFWPLIGANRFPLPTSPGADGFQQLHLQLAANILAKAFTGLLNCTLTTATPRTSSKSRQYPRYPL